MDERGSRATTRTVGKKKLRLDKSKGIVGTPLRERKEVPGKKARGSTRIRSELHSLLAVRLRTGSTPASAPAKAKARAPEAEVSLEGCTRCGSLGLTPSSLTHSVLVRGPSHGSRFRPSCSATVGPKG